MSNMSTYSPEWRKSSRSNDQTLGCCVEVAAMSGEMLVRDSKDPEGSRIALSSAQWTSLITGIKATAH